jgi:hypothetical protein
MDRFFRKIFWQSCPVVAAPCLGTVRSAGISAPKIVSIWTNGNRFRERFWAYWENPFSDDEISSLSFIYKFIVIFGTEIFWKRKNMENFRNFGSKRRDWNRKMEKVAPYLISIVLFLQVGVFVWWLVDSWGHLTNMDDVESTIYFITISLNLIFLLFEAFKIFWERNCFHLLLFVFMACFTTFCNLLISFKSNWYFFATIVVQT